MACVVLILPNYRLFPRYLLGVAPVLPMVLPMLIAAALKTVPGATWGKTLPAYNSLDLADNRAMIYLHTIGPYRLQDPSGALDIAGVPFRLAAGCLALLSFLRAPSKLWLPVLLGLVMAMGPILPYKGHLLPLPYLAFYQWFPFFSRLLFPDRALCIVAVGLALLAGMGLQAVLDRVGRNYMRPLVAVLFLMMVVETLPNGAPLTATELPTSPILSRLKSTEGGIIEVPMRTAPFATALQPLHQRPAVFGMGAAAEFLWPPPYRDLVTGNSFLSQLMWMDRGALDFSITDDPAARQALHRLGVTQVVVYSKQYSLSTGVAPNPMGDRMKTQMEKILGDPVYEDDFVAVYTLYKVPRKRRERPQRQEFPASPSNNPR
jgi:hypothetical protein